MSKNKSKLPILMMVFNRPDLTRKVFNEVKKYKPKKLFISCDGPRVEKKKKLSFVRKFKKYLIILIGVARFTKIFQKKFRL